MPSIVVDVAPAMMDWMINFTFSNNADTEIVNNMIKWKNGEKKPTFNQIESVSKATHIPLGYFFLQSPPNEHFNVLQYRTIESLNSESPSRDLVDTINEMENIQEWMRNHIIDDDYDKLFFVGSQKGTKNVSVVANSIRETLNIKIDWYKNTNTINDAFKLLRNRMEVAGILVMLNGIVGNNTHRSLDIEEFRAFTLIDDYAPLIFINSNDSQGAKLFSLVHECAHIWLGIDNFYNDRVGRSDKVNPKETLCNAVAAEILVPNCFFEKEWNHLSGKEVNDKICQLASLFHCSSIVIARKALDSGYIDKNSYDSVVNEAIKSFNDSRKKTSGGNYYATMATRLDHSLIIALDNSVREGKTQFTDAYRLTNTNRRTFSKLVEEVRGIRQ